ncbi:rhomboid-like protein [Streptomyces sp. NPDC005263]|uniref:rhomboid-like protein n=1 Tax=Streptomyces sp. NPDC005263 TaxID=3364711 RepID=UPI0036B74186
MNRTVTAADTTADVAPSPCGTPCGMPGGDPGRVRCEAAYEAPSEASVGTGLPDAAGLLEAMPRQRNPTAPATTTVSPPPATPVAASTPAAPAAARRPRPWRLLPTPTGTPFTFGYVALLAVTSLITAYADPAVVHTLHQASSTDVAHLVRWPMVVLPASALWIAGGLLSPYATGLLLALTALERRIGGVRTAGVFLLGHVLATLATEGAVGLAVLAGHLPDSSLHRLDYGVSFGVATCVGALAGLLTPWLRRPLLAAFGGMVVLDLIAFTDPMTNWGHLISLGIGVATWPVTRRARRAHPATTAG